MTVLFADVVGSTALGDQLDPERFHAVLESYWTAMSEVVKVWGGTLEKFIGDAIVAVFGVPAVREDDAERALRAGLEMLQRLDSLNRELDERHGVALQMRIGVNTGEVLAAHDTSDLTVSGDVVNVAARLQAAAGVGTVLVGERAWLGTQSQFRFGDPIELPVKGKPKPLAARVVEGPELEQMRAPAARTSPLVGRVAELSALTGLLENVIELRQPRLVSVIGPPGVGKSRLAQEWIRQVTDSYPHAIVRRGRCLAAGRGITYSALGEIMRSACGIALDDPADVAAAKLRASVNDERTAFALAATVGIPLPANPLERMEPQAVMDEMARGWARFANDDAEHLAVWVVEDLHWASQALVDMLERIVARTAGAFLLLVTARPELAQSHPGFGTGSEDFSIISLRPLSGRESTELLKLLGAGELDPSLRTQILDRAEGNPLFLEEIARHLFESGSLAREESRRDLTPRSLAVPDSLLALVSARIDSLSDAEKRVLQEAAVVGRVFWVEPLRRNLPDTDVSKELLALERRGLVSLRPTPSEVGETEYIFKHALIWEVAYSSIPKARRAKSHARVGSWLEELAGERSDEFAELLAFHFSAAASGEDADLAWDRVEREPLRTKATEYLIQAGNAARRRFAISRAVEFHQRALGLAAHDDQRLRVLEEVGDDHASAFEGEDAEAAYLQALTIARRPERRTENARLCWKTGDLMADNPGAFRHSPDPEVAEGLVAEGLGLQPGGRNLARLLIASGTCARLYRGSEPFGRGSKPDPIPIDERISRVRQALGIGESQHLPDVIRVANARLAILYGLTGDYQQMLRLAHQELETLDDFDSRLEQADVLRRVAMLEMSLEGRYEHGLELSRRALELSKDSSPHQLMHATSPILEALYQLGRWHELESVLEEHTRAFKQDPAVECQLVRDGPVIGATMFAQRQMMEHAGELAALLPDPLEDLESASAWQARLAVAMGKPEIARRISEGKALSKRTYGPHHALATIAALATLREWAALGDVLPAARLQVAGNAQLAPWCDRAESQVAAQTGNLAYAITLLRGALAEFERLKVPFETARTQQILAELVDGDEKEELLGAATETYSLLGVPAKV